MKIASDIDAISRNMLLEADNIINNAERSSQVHSITAKYFSGANWALGTANVALAAIAGSMQLKNMNVNPTLIGMMCLIVMVMTAIIAFWKIDAKSRDHHHAGISYQAIKDDAAHFMNIDTKMNVTIDEKVRRLEDLSKRLKDQNVNSPLVPWFAMMFIRMFEHKDNKIRTGTPNATNKGY